MFSHVNTFLAEIVSPLVFLQEDTMEVEEFLKEAAVMKEIDPWQVSWVPE